jgi:hypothetical protein
MVSNSYDRPQRISYSEKDSRLMWRNTNYSSGRDRSQRLKQAQRWIEGRISALLLR